MGDLPQVLLEGAHRGGQTGGLLPLAGGEDSRGEQPGVASPADGDVATGTPAGICTMESRESMPSRYFSGTGTPMTGSSVTAASIPGR